jgi:hypothetical protein
MLLIHTCQNEDRLRALERDSTEMNAEIKNLVKSLDGLTSWIKGLVLVLIPVVCTSFGWLMVQAFIKK